MAEPFDINTAANEHNNEDIIVEDAYGHSPKIEEALAARSGGRSLKELIENGQLVSVTGERFISAGETIEVKADPKVYSPIEGEVLNELEKNGLFFYPDPANSHEPCFLSFTNGLKKDSTATTKHLQMSPALDKQSLQALLHDRANEITLPERPEEPGFWNHLWDSILTTFGLKGTPEMESYRYHKAQYDEKAAMQKKIRTAGSALEEHNKTLEETFGKVAQGKSWSEKVESGKESISDPREMWRADETRIIADHLKENLFDDIPEDEKPLFDSFRTQLLDAARDDKVRGFLLKLCEKEDAIHAEKDNLLENGVYVNAAPRSQGREKDYMTAQHERISSQVLDGKGPVQKLYRAFRTQSVDGYDLQLGKILVDKIHVPENRYEIKDFDRLVGGARVSDDCYLPTAKPQVKTVAK